jgi:hypothetical protein
MYANLFTNMMMGVVGWLEGCYEIDHVLHAIEYESHECALKKESHEIDVAVAVVDGQEGKVLEQEGINDRHLENEIEEGYQKGGL